jgi:hypothetical protein
MLFLWHWFKKQSSTGSIAEALHNSRGILHDSQVAMTLADFSKERSIAQLTLPLRQDYR